MSDVQFQVTKLVDLFVQQVTAVARRAAMETLTSALERPAGRTRAATAPARSIPAPQQPRRGRKKGEKRPTTEIAETMSRLASFIQANPGLRVEQINKALGTSTREVGLPLRKLLADGVLRSEGVKRSTQYFARKGSPTRAAPAPIGPRRRRKT